MSVSLSTFPMKSGEGRQVVPRADLHRPAGHHHRSSRSMEVCSRPQVDCIILTCVLTADSMRTLPLDISHFSLNHASNLWQSSRYQSAELVSCRAARWLQTENCRPHLQHCAIPGMAWIVIELVHILLINNHTYNLTWHLQHILNLVIQITFYFKWIILSNCTEHLHI